MCNSFDKLLDLTVFAAASCIGTPNLIHRHIMASVRELPTPRRSTGFEDLPGEIRNTIYRAVCDEVSISTEQDPRGRFYDAMVIEGVFYITVGEDQHTNVSKSFRKPRPLAMLGASRQIQQEFVSMLIPPCMSPHPDGPYQICYLYDANYSHWTGGDLFWKSQVSASFRHRNAACIEVGFEFELPYRDAFDQRSLRLIETTITELFDEAGKFTFLHFLQAADILFASTLRLQVKTNATTQLGGVLEYHMALKIEHGVSHIFGSCHR